jgi:hypothetical protein
MRYRSRRRCRETPRISHPAANGFRILDFAKLEVE